MKNMHSVSIDEIERPSLTEATRVFGEIGLLSFGGPAAQISLMHKKLVDDNKWLTEKQFLGALNFCMLLPGPEAMQLATYAGWRLHGMAGGLLAGLLFVIPGAAVVLLLAILYGYYGEMPLINTLFIGIKAAVLIIVIEALLKVSRRALISNTHWAIAGVSFLAIFFLRIPFPIIIFIAAVSGYFLHGLKNRTIKSGSESPTKIPTEVQAKEQAHEQAHEQAQSQTEVHAQSEVHTPAQKNHLKIQVNVSSTLYTGLIGLIIWFLPLMILGLTSNYEILMDIGAFFSKLAIVTFGGAYAVLAYMGQDVVQHFNWLTAGEMMDGLGLAETTPGPLILVTQFVGYLAAFRSEGMALGLAAAAITLWVTFVPCFMWIFMGAPYIEWISAQPRLHSAMSAITAAVVGVILNLSIWFAMHVVFTDVHYRSLGVLTLPQLSFAAIDWRVPPLSLLCGYLLLKEHWNITAVLVISATLAWFLSVVF